MLKFLRLFLCPLEPGGGCDTVHGARVRHVDSAHTTGGCLRWQ